MAFHFVVEQATWLCDLVSVIFKHVHNCETSRIAVTCLVMKSWIS